MSRPLAWAYIGLFLVGSAGGLALAKHPGAAAIAGTVGAVLSISALIWILRREGRR